MRCKRRRVEMRKSFCIDVDNRISLVNASDKDEELAKYCSTTGLRYDDDSRDSSLLSKGSDDENVRLDAVQQHEVVATDARTTNG